MYLATLGRVQAWLDATGRRAGALLRAVTTSGPGRRRRGRAGSAPADYGPGAGRRKWAALASAGTSVAARPTAGRWSAPQMPRLDARHQ